MKILVTLPKDCFFERFFPDPLTARLEACGDVTWNRSPDQFSPDELGTALGGVGICVTGWHVPRFDNAIIEHHADRLRLIAHMGGTVAPVVSESVYERGIRVSSGNAVMAKVVAEAVLGYFLGSLRSLVHFDRALHTRPGWSRDLERCRSLFGRTVGFVGLGTVGRALLDLLRPFDVRVLIHDPYIDGAAIAPWPFAERVDLDTCLSAADLISIHAAATEETRHLLDARRLGALRDGALLVNAARGGIIEEEAFIAELETGRLSAVLDVYSDEPLADDSPLRRMENVILTPHVAGSPSHPLIGEAMVGEVERMTAGDELHYSIPVEQFRLMTR